MKLKLDSPFFIIGCGSSGSTLLSVLLDRHPLIACGPELSVFNKKGIYCDYFTFRQKLPSWLERGLSTDGRAEYRNFFFNLNAYFWDKNGLIALANNVANLRDFFDLFFTHYLEIRKKIIWGEKTGSNSYCAMEIQQLYPNARFIHIVRDGRDVVCSLMRRPYNYAFHSISAWLYEVSAALSHRELKGYIQVRYEDLVTDPKRQLERICHHLGVEFVPQMLSSEHDNYWRNHSNGNVHRSWRKSPFSSSISKDSVGRFRTDLPEDVQDLFWRIRLTSFSRKKLKVRHKGTTYLMRKFGYIKKPPVLRNTHYTKYYLEAIKEVYTNFKRKLFFEHRIRLPMTWIKW